MALGGASRQVRRHPVHSTQEDPIGLAGGLNLYGYAGGDPINSSDPFGLCPIDKPLCHWIEATSTAVGLVTGFVAGGGGAALTGVGVVASPATAMAGSAVGAAWGLAAGKALTGALLSESGESSGGGGAAGDSGPQDHRLSNGEIRRMQRAGEDIHGIKGGRNASKYDLYKDADGNIFVKPKGGKGPGEATGLNINDYRP